jgi:hypothetical protein
MKRNKITICGGGALGHVCAAVFSSQGNHVNILTGHPDSWNYQIVAHDINGKDYTGKIENISNNPDIVSDSEFILLCVPGYLIHETLLNIKPYLSPRAIVGSVVSSTGFFYEAHKILPNNIGLLGFQRVPFVARVVDYGSKANLLGYRKQLFVAFEHVEQREQWVQTLADLTMTPVKLVDSIYEVSLTNSNPILHTSRLFAMWHEWNGEATKTPILFYREWNDEASSLLIKMDNEFMSIVRKLEIKVGEPIQPLLEYYESYDASSLTNKIKSIPAFENILAPMKETEQGWIPDFSSRYFTEDFPYGLRFIKELAEKLELDIPFIQMVYSWGMSCIPKNAI